MKRRHWILVLLPVLLVIAFMFPIMVKADVTRKIDVIIFYSNTCESCNELEGYFEDISLNYPNANLIRYNIAVPAEKALLDEYEALYKVPEKERGIIPKVFVGDKCLAGKENIKELLEHQILYSEVDTLEVNSSKVDNSKTIEKFESFKLSGVFAAGFVNGLNPCSLSMLLFFLSLLTLDNRRIRSSGIAFAIGKFIAFFLFGTLLCTVLARVDLSKYAVISKVLLLTFIITLILLNIKDAFVARKERYGDITLQMPTGLRNFNHNLIKKITAFGHSKLLALISLFFGLAVSLGEFLCTGQLYLLNIVTVIQTEKLLTNKALLYLTIYNIALILPIILITFIIAKGKEALDVSDKVRMRLPIIKLANVALLVAYIVFLF